MGEQSHRVVSQGAAAAPRWHAAAADNHHRELARGIRNLGGVQSGYLAQ